MANSNNEINVLSEEKEEVPTTEFAEALEELEYMETHPEEYKSFYSVEELMKDLSSDD